VKTCTEKVSFEISESASGALASLDTITITFMRVESTKSLERSYLVQKILIEKEKKIRRRGRRR